MSSHETSLALGSSYTPYTERPILKKHTHSQNALATKNIRSQKRRTT
jgi:hypothetical protein